MSEQEQREAIVKQAKAAIGTRFIHGCRIKGIGYDCETFICEVFAGAGVFTAQGIPYVPAQWFMNSRQELYLNYLSKYASEYQPAFGPRPSAVGQQAAPPADDRRPTTDDQEVARLSRAAGPIAQTTPLPGDIIVVKTRWVYSHGAIVVAWPRVIHCYPPCVSESDVYANPVFYGHELKFFNPFSHQQSAVSGQPNTPAAPAG